MEPCSTVFETPSEDITIVDTPLMNVQVEPLLTAAVLCSVISENIGKEVVDFEIFYKGKQVRFKIT